MKQSPPFLRCLGLVLLLVTISAPHLLANEVFNDFSIQTNNDSSLLLFPSHRIPDIMVSRVNSELLFIDMPYFSMDTESRVMVAPHPKVRFARLSQVSSNPPVVRATVLFYKNRSMAPILREGHLYLEEGKNAEPHFNDSQGSYAGNQLPANPPSYRTSSPGRDVLDQRVTLSFNQEDLSTILNALAMKLGLHIFADAGVRGKFTIQANDVPLRDVLRNLLLQRNFQYTMRGRDLTVISLSQGSGKMARELLFRDLSLKDALQTLSKMMGVNLIIHETVPDKMVNFYVENLSLDELLDLLIKTNDLVRRPHNENTFVILTKEEARKYGVKEYRTFKLVNAKPEDIIKLISSNKSLSEKLDTANISVDERINAMSVYDTSENLELIERVVNSHDEKLKQAVIEVKLLDIERSGLKKLGISLDNYSLSLGNDISRIPRHIPIGATLDLLEQEGKSKVLASPKIRAIHGKTASIIIGDTIPVPYTRYEVASNAYLGFTPQTFKEYRDVKVGINLEVKPEISRDNEITLEINTRVDSKWSVDQLSGQITRSDAETKTSVRVKDGETVVLGGLIRQDEGTTKNSPSILNKVPMFRTLLTHGQNRNSDREMIMLVTPHLVNLDPEDTMEPRRGLLVEQNDSHGAWK